MNKIAALTLTLSALVGLSEAASAQENDPNARAARGMRFDYAPNIWKESGNKPHGYQNINPVMGAEPITVHAGSVPHGMSGLTPDMLAPRVAPIAQTAIRPSANFVSAVPINIPPAIPNFKQSFGMPAKPMAALNVPPAATARTAPGKSNAAHSNKPVIAHSVSGKMIHPHLPGGHSAGSANSLPTIASYGNNQGYNPGAYLPSVASGGTSTATNVSGRLFLHH